MKRWLHHVTARVLISAVFVAAHLPVAKGTQTSTYAVETPIYVNQGAYPDGIYEIMRISRDAPNWSQNIPYQVTVRSSYYRPGGIVKAQIQYGYLESGMVSISEAQGNGMMAPYLGAEVTVSGTIKYRPVLVKIPSYMTANIEVQYNTAAVSLITASGQVQFTGTFLTTTGASYYDGTVNNIALAVGYNGSTAPAGGAIFQGNVGIGTTAPPYTLSVKGTVGAQEVIVTSTSAWPDYVFEPDYRVAPLSEVATYVGENGHLPGIPSAAEVAAKGVGLGEMQAKLLAKIEELTLYMIEAEKRMNRMEKENAELKRQLAGEMHR